MIETLESEKVKSIGIDTESLLFDKSLQLIQIATINECYLIRRKYVTKLGNDLLEKLGNILSTKLVLFFSGSNDCDQLSKFISKIELINVLYIQKLVNELGFRVTASDGIYKQKVSLSDCVKEWLKKPLNKDYTLSNWGTDNLSEIRSSRTSKQLMRSSTLGCWLIYLKK